MSMAITLTLVSTSTLTLVSSTLTPVLVCGVKVHFYCIVFEIIQVKKV